MNPKTYIAVYPLSTKFAEGHVVNPKYDHSKRETCPICGEGLSGSEWIGETVIKVNKKNVPDFLYFYGGTNLPFLISERAYNVLIENGIDGISEVKKIDKVILRRDVLDITFYQIFPIRLDCPIDHSQSKLVYGENIYQKCVLCRPMGRIINFIFGFCFKPNTNIGKDIFITYEMGGAIFLSERFIKVCEDNKLTGLDYEEISEYNSGKGIFSKEEIEKLLNNQIKPI